MEQSGVVNMIICMERGLKMADEYIKRKDIGLTDFEIFMCDGDYKVALELLLKKIESIPSADVVEIPKTGIGDLSDGYHTFNGLYYQRMVLFNALVNAYNDRAWKSWKHEDGEPCFGGGWFIVGIDTPKGSYTYHYEDKYWNLFECEELPVAKHWDGHTEEDVTRLLTLPDVAEVVRCKDCRFHTTDPECFDEFEITDKPMMCVGIRYGGVDPDWFCEHGERMDGGR